MRTAAVLLVVGGLAVSAGCASSPGMPSAGSTGRTVTDLADTPEAAALGFEHSLDNRGGFRFACLPGPTFATAGWRPTGPLTASSERRNTSTWAVSLVDESFGQTLHRWKVSLIGTGYCVSGEFSTPGPPPPSPSSPGSGTDRFSPSTIAVPASTASS